jgi:flagellin-like protein
MFENKTDQEKRGQVGIGTLIVFIAMVLVAAIAAGVLINTAGFLQTQAEATGEESTAQVTNNVDIVSSIGKDTGSGSIDTVDIVIKKSAGSDPIDVGDIQIQYVSPNGVVTTTVSSATDISTSAVSGSTPVLESQSDRIELTIDLDGGNEFSNTLGAGAEAEITLTTASGAQTFETLRVSDPLSAPEDL